MDNNNTEHLVTECRRIEEDCLYTGEAHYIIANSAATTSLWIRLTPAIAAAASGTALLSGAPGWIAWFSVIAGVAFALQSILNPDKKREIHSLAGKQYTCLKHEARALYQTFFREMSHDMTFGHSSSM